MTVDNRHKGFSNIVKRSTNTDMKISVSIVFYVMKVSVNVHVLKEIGINGDKITKEDFVSSDGYFEANKGGIEKTNKSISFSGEEYLKKLSIKYRKKRKKIKT